jgi:hypothetical protein
MEAPNAMPAASAAQNACTKDHFDIFTSDATIHSTIQSYVDDSEFRKTGAYLVSITKYLRDNEDVRSTLKYMLDGYQIFDGAKKGFMAARYTGDLNLRIQDWGASGAAGVLGVFVDRFSAMADYQGIKLDKVTLGLTNVLLDIIGARTASVATAFTGPVGFTLLVVGVIKTYKDSKETTELIIEKFGSK